jgi:hypothetical protein
VQTQSWMLLDVAALAILTAVAPIAVLIGSSPAHAGPQEFAPCSPEAASVARYLYRVARQTPNG